MNENSQPLKKGEEKPTILKNYDISSRNARLLYEIKRYEKCKKHSDRVKPNN